MAIDPTAPNVPPVVYRSHVTVEPGRDRAKLVSLPAEGEPVVMGFHGDLAPRFGLVEGEYEPRASTLDYLVGATVGCMTGVLNAALKARGIPTGDGRLQVEAVGDVELDDDILVVRRIHVVAHLVAAEAHRPAAERVAATYERRCPIYRTIGSAVRITTELDFRPLATS